MTDITGTDGDDTLSGTSGSDTINGLGGNDTIDGGDGRDVIDGGSGNDVIHAGSSDDQSLPEVIRDGPGNDAVFGEGDQDLIYGSPGDDYYDGGTGGLYQPFENDEVTYADASAGIVVDLTLSSGQVHSAGSGDPANIGVDTLVNIERIDGSHFADVMTAGAAPITFFGDAGADVLIGGSGNDTLMGGADDDSLSGNDGDDILEGGDGTDQLYGGAGSDTASYLGASAGVHVSLANLGSQNTIGAGTDSLSSIENLYGSHHDDVLTGNDFSNLIFGAGGNDVLIGAGGDDHLDGSYPGTGSVVYIGGAGNDIIETNPFGQDDVEFRPGDGLDTVNDLDSTDQVTIYGYSSAQSITQAGGDVVVHLSNADQITFRGTDLATVQSLLHFVAGTPQDDTLNGGPGDDILAGAAGADIINGNDGADTLYSGDASPPWQVPFFLNNPDYVGPVLDRGSEVDTLNGGAGIDRIFAGYGDNVDGGADLADLLISLCGATSGVTADFSALDNGGTLTLGGGLIQNIRSVLWIEGTDFDDTITGSNQGTPFGTTNAPIFGLGGNDHIIAGANTGNVYGGDGNDTIDTYYNGVYYGDAGDDTINATGSSSLSFGGAGNDTLNVAGSADGGAGNDVITLLNISFMQQAFGNDGDDTLNGSTSSDRLYGGNGADIISASDGADTISSAGFESLGVWDLTDRGSEHDVIFAGSGDDMIFSGYGDDVDGGTGFNTLALSLMGATAGVTLNVGDLEGGNAYVLGGGTITNIQRVTSLYGSNFDDVLTLSRVIPVYGMDGNDTINGSSDADQIHGGAGADIINAGDGNDLIYVDNETDLVPGEQIHGGAGIDFLINDAEKSIDDEYLSLAGVTLDGIEVLRTTASTGFAITQDVINAVTALDGRFQFAESGAISLAGKTAPTSVIFMLNAAGNILDMTAFTFGGTLTVGGSAVADTIIGTAQSDNIFGDKGDDILRGGAGIDFLHGDEGNDLLDGGSGQDVMSGGAGNDTYIVDDADIVQELLGSGTDTVQASVSFALSANVENLVLTGSTAINGSGNVLANVIVGNDGSNVLSGGAGADTLTGGGGNDTFADTAAGLNGDTITDLDVGDRIIISNASLSGFTFSLTGNVLTYTGGSLTLTNVPHGSFVVSAAAGGGVQLTVTHAVHNDFNGDGISDLLWRHSSGDVMAWLGVSDGRFWLSDWHRNVGPDWQVAATGDFDGDGKADLLWRSGDGHLTDWLGTSTGAFADNLNNLYRTVDADWQVAGTGDFDGDGKSDILWRNSDGRVTDWLGRAGGGFADNLGNFYRAVSTDWHVVGTGDFNGDGRADILWRSKDGWLTDWLGTANGGFVDNLANAYGFVATEWRVAGIGDFNGDGYADILWRNIDGRLTDWLGTANGSFTDNLANAYATVATDWQVQAIGDFNGDGREDVLWRNSDGRITQWLGSDNGSFRDNLEHSLQSVSTTWHLEPQLSTL